MTLLEIILSIILWVIIGFWINFKLSIAYDRPQFDDDVVIVPCVMFAPIMLVLTLINQFIFKDWVE